VVGGRTAASLSGQASRGGVRVSAPDGSSMSPAPSPDAQFSSIPSPRSAASIDTTSPARRARPLPGQLELFAASQSSETPRDRCIDAIRRWNVTEADTASAVDDWMAAVGSAELEHLIAGANSTTGRRNHGRRWGWLKNQIAKLVRRAEIARVASVVKSASANDDDAGAAVIDLGACKAIIGRLVEWGVAVDAAGPLAWRLITALRDGQQAIEYVECVRRRRLSAANSIAMIKEYVARNGCTLRGPEQSDVRPERNLR
jgi:hypothetical protein